MLQLGGNQVASISSLQLGGLSSLRSLFLQNNDITRVDGLAGLVNLQVRFTLESRMRWGELQSSGGAWPERACVT